jgi:hypothetical protein
VGGFYKAIFDNTNSKTLNKSIEALRMHTVDVEKKCPFAETLGISGSGEGIAWKTEHPLSKDPRL